VQTPYTLTNDNWRNSWHLTSREFLEFLDCRQYTTSYLLKVLPRYRKHQTPGIQWSSKCCDSLLRYCMKALCPNPVPTPDSLNLVLLSWHINFHSIYLHIDKIESSEQLKILKDQRNSKERFGELGGLVFTQIVFKLRKNLLSQRIPKQIWKCPGTFMRRV